MDKILVKSKYDEKNAPEILFVPYVSEILLNLFLIYRRCLSVFFGDKGIFESYRRDGH